MIPDGFQCFLNLFGTTNCFTKSGPVDPAFITKNTSNIYKKNYENIIKLFFISLENVKFPDVLTLPDIKSVELMFSLFSKSGGSKTIGFPKRFQRFFGGGILIHVDNL